MAGHLRPCLICGTPARASHCEKHQIDHGYSEHDWRAYTRPAVLERDNWRCRIQADDGCTVIATTVHRLPEHGPHHDTNLDAYVSACAHCHGVIDAPRAKR